jgi:hypothetical protein
MPTTLSELAYARERFQASNKGLKPSKKAGAKKAR